jgi:hypothetical protein
VRKLTTIALAAGALAVPAVAVAEEAPAKNAAKECKALKKNSGTPGNFASVVRTFTKAKVTTKNAYGKCVSAKTQDEKNESKAAKIHAAKTCKAEQKAGPAAFRAKYGTNTNKSNAYGKCVASKSKGHKAKSDKADRQKVAAAKSCRTEQKAGPTAFKAKYGTNRNKSNAFGRCVSAKAKAEQA